MMRERRTTRPIEVLEFDCTCREGAGNLGGCVKFVPCDVMGADEGRGWFGPNGWPDQND